MPVVKASLRPSEGIPLCGYLHSEKTPRLHSSHGGWRAPHMRLPVSRQSDVSWCNAATHMSVLVLHQRITCEGSGCGCAV